MKEIPLTKGKVAIVDDSDFDWLSKWKWSANNSVADRWYAVRVDKNNKMFKMHRVIMGITDPLVKVDHKESEGLDNRRSNLRVATQLQNTANSRSRKNSTSKYKGVHWDRFNNQWRAETQFGGIRKRIGRYNSEIEAALAYNNVAKQIQGEFAKLNIIQ